MAVKDVPKIIVNKNGISMIGLLTVILIVLKLTKNIDISWWWVFAPMWIPWIIILGIIAAILLGVFVVFIIVFLLEKYEDHKTKSYKIK